MTSKRRSPKPSRKGKRLHTCSWCRRRFLTRNANRRYCSPACCRHLDRYYKHWKPILDGLDDFEDFLAGFFRVHAERLTSEEGDEAARAWLDTASFECWVDLLPGDVDPDWMRKMLLG